MTLTAKQQNFVDEYLKCWNATEAARRAGYQATNGSLATIGYENLRKVEIASQIDKRLQESAMSANEVLMRLADTARGDVGEFCHIESNVDLASHPLSRLVKKFKRTVTHAKSGEIIENIELELYDAQGAQQLIGKHWGLFTDRMEHTGPDGGPIEIKEVVVELPNESMAD